MRKPANKPMPDLPVPWEKTLAGMPPMKVITGRRGKGRVINRHRIVVNICLYPQDLQKLDDLCKGQPRMRSTVVRHLIRSCREVHSMDLVVTQQRDYQLSDFNRAMGMRGPR